MHKRLLEIVLYILDRSDEDIIDGDNGAESLQDLLADAGFDREDIVRALRYTLNRQKGESGETEIMKDLDVSSATLSREAWDYLERLRQFGLISDEESGEVLHRAADLPGDDVDLDSIRFLAASIIFDRDAWDFSVTDGIRIH